MNHRDISYKLYRIRKRTHSLFGPAAKLWHLGTLFGSADPCQQSFIIGYLDLATQSLKQHVQLLSWAPHSFSTFLYTSTFHLCYSSYFYIFPTLVISFWRFRSLLYPTTTPIPINTIATPPNKNSFLSPLQLGFSIVSVSYIHSHFIIPRSATRRRAPTHF
jgi:hypothetical protein